jgi:hypothetical protein
VKKEDFPRTKKSCRVLFKHLKKHGLGFVLDLELDEIQMEYLLIVSWKVFSSIDFSNQFYPDDCLRNVIPVFPFPYTRSKKRMERYYKGHLHKKETLRSTNRGGVVKLTREDIKNHTDPQDEIDESEDKEEGGGEAEKETKVSWQGKRGDSQTCHNHNFIPRSTK